MEYEDQSLETTVERMRRTPDGFHMDCPIFESILFSSY
jgi:hypothetical protein